MKTQTTTLKRSAMCGHLTEGDVGNTVTVMGWLDTRRDLGSLVFIDLRDREGIIQCVFDRSKYEGDFDIVDAIRSEYVLGISGTLTMRDQETINNKIPTGTIEVKAETLQVLSKAKTPPFYIEDGIKTREELRLKYRYLDLRRPEMLKKVRLRHSLAQRARNFLDEHGFIEVETPMLTRSTPEGARDYLVPSRVQQGKFYALPQSPQQFKQMLMTSGLDRYYQIARCFRDEDLRADRQPEFTQIDIEMSFVTAEDVMQINEKLVCELFEEAWNTTLPTPFQRMTYQEVMERYGVDKPDIRFDMELTDISDIVEESDFNVFASSVKAGGSTRGINVKNSSEDFARRDLDALVEYVKQFGARGMAWITVEECELKSAITKFFTEVEIDAILKRMDAEPGDTLMFVSDARDDIVFEALGQLRNHLAQKLNLIKEDDLGVLWVTEFPLLEYDYEDKRYYARHHPFTSVMDEDAELLDTDPSKARAKAYDLVINGMEIGGGSIRNHTPEMQKRVFEALSISEEDMQEKFGYFLESFEYGTPPHGGIAYGFDRICMLLSGSSSIRDIIAFPKVQTASCPLTHAPSVVDQKQLDDLALVVEKKTDES